MDSFAKANILLPNILHTLLSGTILSENKIGQSGSAVYHIDNFFGKSAYLKISPSVWHMTLQHELNALIWLKGKFPVPEVLHFEEYNGQDYLIISELKGMDASNESLLSKPDELVRLYAEGIRKLHCLDIQDCPLNQKLEYRLLDAEKRITEEIINETNLEEENKLRTPSDIYNELLINKPESEDLVFTHGDYCLPNVIINEGKVSGFIDLGKAGIADRYQDIALAIRSLRHNYKTDKFKKLFIECYGINELDKDKVEFYILLDELF